MHLFDMMDYLLRDIKLVMVILVMVSWSRRINGRYDRIISDAQMLATCAYLN